jgi:hypothetical protein
MKKTYSQYIQYIKLMLGAVPGNEDSLEYLNDTLTEFVKIAFSEIEPYINVRERRTIPWSNGANGAISLKDIKARAKSIVSVRRGSDQGYLNSTYTTTAGTWYYGYSMPIFGGSFSASFDPWVLQALMLKNINTISGDRQFLFDYDRQLLFVNFNQQYPTSITIEYIPEYDTAEQIEDSYWQNILQQYALALVKISLSHYRGKFSQLDGTPFKLNYEKLETEGKAEREQIWNDLVENNLLNYRFD